MNIEYVKGSEYQGRLKVGMRIRWHVYSNDGIIVAIHGEQSPESIGSIAGVISYGGSASIDVVFEDHISHGIPESIIRGVQWSISEEMVNPFDVVEAIENARKAEEQEKKDKIQKEEEKKQGRQNLRESHPELKQVDPQKYDNLIVGAKNIRTELKNAYPGIKFSVRSSSFSGGDDIRINWTDGPTTEEVEKISGKYQEGHFDGMTDSYNYNRDNIWTDVYGGSKYVFANRESSNEAYLEAVVRVEQEWGIVIEVTGYERDDGSLSLYIEREHDVNVDKASGSCHWSAGQLINRKLSETRY